MSRIADITPNVMMVVLCFSLTGCAPQEPWVPTERVEVPVLVSCKTQEILVPPLAAASLKKADSLEAKVRTLLAERRQRIWYERESVTAV